MGDKTIVLTLYGTKDTISDFSITLFDKSDRYDEINKAQDFCSNINDLELKDNNWIYATVIKENQKSKLIKPGYIDFDLLASLDDREIQQVLGQIKYDVLKIALRSTKKDVLNAVLRNVSKRAAYMLIEDLKRYDLIPLKDIKKAQKQIVEHIQFMIKIGEITIPKQ